MSLGIETAKAVLEVGPPRKEAAPAGRTGRRTQVGCDQFTRIKGSRGRGREAPPPTAYFDPEAHAKNLRGGLRQGFLDV
jgi:hypothetical protein